VLDARERGGLEDISSELDLPKNLVGLDAGAVGILHLDQVVAARLRSVEGLDAGDHRPAVPNDRHHALARVHSRPPRPSVPRCAPVFAAPSTAAV